VTRTGIEPSLTTVKSIGITTIVRFRVQFRVQFLYKKFSKNLDFSMLPQPSQLCYAPVINVTGGDIVKKILIATTSEATSTDLLKSLSQYEVHICSTGTEALELLETLRPDILLLDLMLPVIDGLTVLRRSQFKPRTILALTPLASATVLHSAAAVGVQDILLIPCTTSYIVDRLDALTEKLPSPEV